MKNEQLINLYIFITSDIPDLYINIIGYCIEYYSVNKIFFLRIIKDKGRLSKTNEELVEIKDRVKCQLNLLQSGKYLYKDQKTYNWSEKTIELENVYKSRYIQIAQKVIEIRTILYDELDKELTSFIEEGHCFFDVSGVLKGDLIDIYTLLMMKNVENVHVFELRLSKRTYDEKELIHNLSLDDHNYAYVNLTRSLYTNETTIKTKNEIKDYKCNTIGKFLESLAEQYAKNILIGYTIILLLTLILLVIVILIRHDGWSKIQPWTFLLCVYLPYVIDFIGTIIFKKEIKLRPQLLYLFFKSCRLKKLNKQFEQISKVSDIIST